MNLEELEQEIKAIKERNKRVEKKKKWELNLILTNMSIQEGILNLIQPF